MTSRDSWTDLEPEDLRHYLVQEARADAPRQAARDRALRRVSATVGIVGAGVTVSAAAKGAATSQAAAWGAFGTALKWGGMGAFMAAATLGAVEGVKSVTAPSSDRGESIVVAHRDAPHGVARAPSLSTIPAPGDTKAEPPPLDRAGAEVLDRPTSETNASAENEGSRDGARTGTGPAAPRPDARSVVAKGKPFRSSAHREMPPPTARTAPAPGDPTLEIPSSAALAPIDVPRADPAVERDRILLHEIALLEEARRALADKAPIRASEALGRYDRECPAGSMTMEAMALRIEAFGESNRYAEARALAREFLAKYPRSPLVVRIQSLLDGWARRPQNR